MEFRDDAEALLDEWGLMFSDGGLDELLDELRRPDGVDTLARGGPAPTKVLDAGNLFDLADRFCALGLRRDEVGTRALEVARACYLEIAKWPQPWPAAALRSSVGQQLAARTYPLRPTPAVAQQELAALERAMAVPIAERPWALADLHCAKLQLEWAFTVQNRCRPGVEAIAALALGSVAARPELGAVLAKALWLLQADFVESVSYTEQEREAAMHDLLRYVPDKSWPFIDFLRQEQARGQSDLWDAKTSSLIFLTMPRQRLIEWTLRVAASAPRF